MLSGRSISVSIAELPGRLDSVFQQISAGRPVSSSPECHSRSYMALRQSMLNRDRYSAVVCGSAGLLVLHLCTSRPSESRGSWLSDRHLVGARLLLCGRAGVPLLATIDAQVICLRQRRSIAPFNCDESARFSTYLHIQKSLKERGRALQLSKERAYQTLAKSLPEVWNA